MLGIVIANWNGEKLIDKCVFFLKKKSLMKFNF